MKKGILALLLACTASFTFACDEHGTTGIVEDNNLWIPSNVKSINTISEGEFNGIIDKIEAIYAPIIAAKGKTLEIERKWEDGTVNAYAQQVGNTWRVSMFGGLARHETITRDGFASVVCHELGHHLGGAPKKASWWGSSWASNEGQADYFATSKCLRKFMENDDNASIMSEVEVPAIAVKNCEANFVNENEYAMCLRGSMAGMSLANLFRALRNMTTELKFDTPDPAVVSKTNDNHPAPQCRLDTYFQGALCTVDAYTDVDQNDANIGTCNRTENFTTGLRPLCWFKPGQAVVEAQ
ncbi:peptidase, M48 domain protein [Bacteriovorax sp. BAL6_X]|uniref:ImmA/IrrE family metallo-endopeptidase n=1 Tax=Bacteriovorax sp. BAL6_X TaxID=1201290 RepID=UPI0003860A54|nr:M48 family metalloprotease [Bacteriovorax sp. BAL6_X]EPZ50865.1 peptidase, M48 domain protein [Bacteriovorax sp. BAL6_X]